jgi:pyridoxal phosphate enzyme (YggS family)
VVAQQLDHVRKRIAQACARSGRDPSSVTLVGVTKNVAVDVIQQAVAFGLTELGENRIQEARAKQIALGWGLGAEGSGPEPRTQSPEPMVRWHLVGHLQRNKAKLAVELFDVVHSLDTLELAQALEQHVAGLAQGSRLKARGNENIKPLLEVFIQVNISGETAKFGCRPETVVSLAQVVASFQHLKLAGLMTIAPYADHPETVRPVFRQLRELRDVVASSLEPRASSLKLSMGMSQDFEVAIEEGADVVRVGTAIFGARDKKQETGRE